jgi:heme A synthase
MSASNASLASPNSKSLTRFAWAVLGYNILVIAWGAFVRASGSGAGCGAHWPLCNGQGIPALTNHATIVEATHRVTSGLALIAVIVLVAWTRRVVPAGHRARRAAHFSLGFMISEALVGAGLVLFKLVAHDASLKRGLSGILHLSNTFLLIGALALTAWTLANDADRAQTSAALVPSRKLKIVTLAPLVAVVVLGSSGAIAALGDTLFPALTLREAFAQDVSPLAHLFLRLRVLHPVFALFTGALVFACSTIARVWHPTDRVRTLSYLVTLAFLIELIVGVANVAFLAPVWIQIVHLVLADTVWIGLVLLAWETTFAHADQRGLRSSLASDSATSASPARSASFNG